MAGHHLGETIDIHGGGSDLIFPHHENEIAQSEAANGKPFVHYWVHNGYLMIDREKMSKSLGNFLTAREARKKFPPLAIRLFMLSAHYRSPISFSEEGLLQARAGTERLRNGRAELLFALERRETGSPDETLREAIRKARTDFEVSMEDDFNTAGALGTLFEAIRAVNTHLGARPDMDREGLDSARAFLTVAEEVLGVLGNEEETVDPEGLSDRAVQARIDERNAARRAKDFARSDAIRDELAAGGIILEDTPQGTRFKRT
jgi:cysteinyl-tRNA synthetase